MSMTKNLRRKHLGTSAKARIATVFLAAATVIIPSLAMAGRAESDLYQQIEKNEGKSGKSALDTAAEIMKTYPGHIVAFEAEMERGRLVYEYKIMQLAEKREMEVEVNAEDGRVLRTEQDSLDRDLPRTEKEMNSVVVFADAWRKAEEMFGKYVVEAELEEDHGRLYYEFEILEPFRESKVLIDARTGQPIPVFEHH